MIKKPDFEKPVFKRNHNEKFEVRVSQIPPMDVAFGRITLSDHELLIAVIRKMNELIVQTNSYTELIEEILNWVVGTGLELTVKEILIKWNEEGLLAEIINDALFQQKLDKDIYYDFIENTYNVFVNDTNKNVSENSLEIKNLNKKIDKHILEINESLDLFKDSMYEDFNNFREEIEGKIKEDFEKQNNKINELENTFTLPQLTLFKRLRMGNVYGQGMCIIPELNIILVGRPTNKNQTSGIYKYDLEGKNERFYELPIGHANSLAYIPKRNEVIIAVGGGEKRVVGIDPITMEIVKTYGVDYNISGLSYSLEEDLIYGTYSDGGDISTSKIGLLQYDNEMKLINTVEYIHPVSHQTWWLQGLANFKGTYIISYTDAIDHDKAKHGNSGVCQITKDGKLLADYKLDRFRNTYFEMESVQIIKNDIYIGAISNNYEYTNGKMGYDILKGSLLNKTPNISYSDLDGLNIEGVLHQIYYDEKHIGEQRGTPLLPYNNVIDLFENVKVPNIDIVLKSDLTQTIQTNYYNNINYLRISGGMNKITAFLDIRNINYVFIHGVNFTADNYWGSLIARDTNFVRIENCEFNGNTNNQAMTSSGSHIRCSGCTFNVRHLICVNDGGSALVVGAKGSVREKVFLEGGTVFLANNTSLTSEKLQRNNFGAIYGE